MQECGMRNSEFGMRNSDERTPQEFKRSEERLAGGSHASDRRESQCGMRGEENCFVACGTNSYRTKSEFARGGSPLSFFFGSFFLLLKKKVQKELK